MKTCGEMKDLRNARYDEFLAYVERKILNGLTKGFIFIDEDEVLEHNIAFHDKRWINLLEEALKGNPVQLRNGSKAIILYVIPDTYKFPNGTTLNYPVRGITFNKDGTLDSVHRWNIDGTTYSRTETSPMDIISMWEEPELTQEELFEKALKEKLPLRYKGMGKDYADVYVVAKSLSGSYILEWKDEEDSCVSILSNLPKFEWYLASKEPVKETGTVGLPKPFIPKHGESYYSVSPYDDVPEMLYANSVNHCSIKNGNCFRTKADAQKWIDFMKSKKE